MKHVRLGGTGMDVSAIALGTWMFGTKYNPDADVVVDQQTASATLDRAAALGINFIDTANIYGRGLSETFIGEWLRDQDREDHVIASKVFYALHGSQKIGLSRKIVMAEIDGSLKRLGTEYLDIYYIHGWLESAPLGETLAAMNDLVRAGKVHYVGVSNFTAWQMYEAQRLCDVNGWAPVSVIQPRFNAVDNVPNTIDPAELPLPDLFDACRYKNIAVSGYASLAGGFLTGKYKRNADGSTLRPKDSRAALDGDIQDFPPRWWAVLEAVSEVAVELDATCAQVALKWAMTVPGVTSVPIVGATSPDHLDGLAGAAELEMSPAQHARIFEAGRIFNESSGSYGY